MLDVPRRGSTLDPAADPLLTDGFVYGMVVQHEHQHDETMLATLQLDGAARYHAGRARRRRRAVAAVADEVLVAGGPFVMGTDRRAVGLRQRAAGPRRRRRRRSGSTPRPVTNGAVPRLRRGRRLRRTALLERRRLGHGAGGRPRSTRSSGAREGGGTWCGAALRPVELACPSTSPCSTSAGTRPTPTPAGPASACPTEAEWEKAARGTGRRPAPLPVGRRAATRHANLGQRHFGPAPVGAYPERRQRYGVEQMLGDVWEWTASDFRAYPGFVAVPLPEYSEVFFGTDYKVLRGGSWATHPRRPATTFRNWDYPIRRQIFAGFRCARDA